MNSGSDLIRPMIAQVDSDGRLVTADDALTRLNRRAGGTEGGKLAIPALARLADLSIRLQMRLSRAVRVADENEILELWVEVQPERQLAKINILSWRVIASKARSQSVKADAPAAGTGVARLDHALRLVHATGEAAQGLVMADFGRDGLEILSSLYTGHTDIARLLENVTGQDVTASATLTRISDQQAFNVTAAMVSGNTEISFEPMPDGAAASLPTAVAATPETLFGKHLAPVLRQPLGRIIANAETIGSELQGPIRENYALYARDIANAARHLSALVDDLGDLEAIERADFTTAKDEIELGDVARRAAGLLSLKAADHSISIRTPDETNTVTAAAEFRRTIQILINLVNNAIRYSPDGTEIRIDIEQDGEWAHISVSDEGEGVAPADREKIFEKFERLGRSGDGGSGLGLYISRRLARAMGGDLSVEDAAQGGAKFTLRLPTR